MHFQKRSKNSKVEHQKINKYPDCGPISQCNAFTIFSRLFINPQVLRMEHGTDMTDRSTNQPADGQNGSLGNYTYNLWKVCTFFCGRNLGWLQVFISSTNYKYFERYINNLEWYVLSSAVLKKENKKGWKKKDKGEGKKREVKRGR